MAANHNFFDVGCYRLELYTALKDPPTERKVENWLKAQRIPYGKSSPGFIDSESMFLTAYDIRLIGG